MSPTFSQQAGLTTCDDAECRLAGGCEREWSSEDIYAALVDALELDVPDDERGKPPCCDEEGRPPIDDEVATTVSDLPSANHVLPEFQGGLHVGDFVPEGPDVGWTVTAVEPGRLLLLLPYGLVTTFRDELGEGGRKVKNRVVVDDLPTVRGST